MATASAGRRRRRPLETAAVFVVLLVLPLSQRPFARWGYPYPRSDAVSICVVPVCNATLHARLMVPSKTASMRRAALPVAARGRPQAARRYRVAAAWCLLRVPAGGIGALLAAVSLGGPALPPPEVRH